MYTVSWAASGDLKAIRRRTAFAHAIRGRLQAQRPFPQVEHHALGREPDKHLRSLAQRAFNGESAAVKFHELARQRQAEPGAFEPLREAVIDLPEKFERPLDFVGRHADAGIRDCDAQAGVFFKLGGDADAAVLGSELHCIGEKIDGDMPQSRLISKNGNRRGRKADGQVDLFLLGLGLDGADRLLDDVGKALLAFRKLQLSGLDFRCIENLFDDAEKVIAGLVDVRRIVCIPIGKLTEIPAAHHLGEADNGVERGAQFMAHIREERGLRLACRFRTLLTSESSAFVFAG